MYATIVVPISEVPKILAALQAVPPKQATPQPKPTGKRRGRPPKAK